MTAIGENTPVRLGLLFLVCGLVAAIAFQQGIIQGRVPKEGEFLRTDVFNTWASGFNQNMDLRLTTVEKLADRVGALEREVSRLATIMEGKQDVASPR